MFLSALILTAPIHETLMQKQTHPDLIFCLNYFFNHSWDTAKHSQIYILMQKINILSASVIKSHLNVKHWRLGEESQEQDLRRRTQKAKDQLVRGEDGHVDREGSDAVERQTSEEDGEAFAPHAVWDAVEESSVAPAAHAGHLQTSFNHVHRRPHDPSTHPRHTAGQKNHRPAWNNSSCISTYTGWPLTTSHLLKCYV